ncbi:hypothetical protein ACFLZW_02450 [Chloroflexota bacterium]
MLCQNCKTELPRNAKFCPECAMPVPKQAGLGVDQDVDTVKGDLTGVVAASGSAISGIQADIEQNIGTIESGGAAAGAVIGGEGGNVHVGGQQSYGDQVQGPKQEIHTEGGDYVGRDKKIYGDVVHGDKIGGDKVGGDKVTMMFKNIYQQIDQRREDPDIEKDEIIQTVKIIEEETAKGEAANPNKIERWLKTLGMMAPDILKVIAATLANPVAGVATAIRLVAEKAQAEAL